MATGNSSRKKRTFLASDCRECGRGVSLLVRGWDGEFTKGARVRCAACDTTNWCEPRSAIDGK